MKRKMFLGLCMATFIAPVAMAQYPQLTEEAKQAYQKMMSEERRRSDEAWAKALPVVQKEAREGRPYISWASRPYDLPQARIPAFPGAEGGGMYSFGGRGGKVITVTNLNDRGPGSSVRLVRQVEHVSLSSMFQVLLNWNLPLSSGLHMSLLQDRQLRVTGYVLPESLFG